MKTIWKINFYESSYKENLIDRSTRIGTSINLCSLVCSFLKLVIMCSNCSIKTSGGISFRLPFTRMYRYCLKKTNNSISHASKLVVPLRKRISLLDKMSTVLVIFFFRPSMLEVYAIMFFHDVVLYLFILLPNIFQSLSRNQCYY